MAGRIEKLRTLSEADFDRLCLKVILLATEKKDNDAKDKRITDRELDELIDHA